MMRKNYKSKKYLEPEIKTIKNEDNTKSFECRICGKKTDRKDVLKLHIENKHQKKEKMKCKICGKEYKTTESFLLHVEKHSKKEEEFKCPVCGKGYKKNGVYFKRHVASHKKPGDDLKPLFEEEKIQPIQNQQQDNEEEEEKQEEEKIEDIDKEVYHDGNVTILNLKGGILRNKDKIVEEFKKILNEYKFTKITFSCLTIFEKKNLITGATEEREVQIDFPKKTKTNVRPLYLSYSAGIGLFVDKMNDILRKLIESARLPASGFSFKNIVSTTITCVKYNPIA